MTRQAGVSDPGRRAFLGAAAVGTGAVLAGVTAPKVARAAEGVAPQVDFPTTPGSFGGGAPGTNNRAEIDLYDCEVEGTMPDIDGVFYRVGPDPQYPKDPKYGSDIAFDGEGHVSLFRIQNSHVDYMSRWVRNDR